MQARHVIAAWLAERSVPDWRLDRGRALTSTDERALAQVAEPAGWQRHDFKRLVNETGELMSIPTFRKASAAISGALKATPQLDAQALKRLVPVAPTKPQPKYKTFPPTP